MSKDPIWEYFNAMRDRRVGDIPIDDLVAIVRGSGMDRPVDVSDKNVPGLLGPVSPKEVPGNWGRQAIIKYNPSRAEVDAGILAQAPLLALEGANRRPCAITIDIFPAAESAPGTATYPTGTDTNGNKLSYRAQGVLSYGVSYGQTGFRSDKIYFDVGRGQRVTVVANIAYLSALMLAPPTGYISGSMSVGAAMCINDAITYAPPVVTSFIDSLLEGASSDPIIIPSRCNFLLPILSTRVSVVTLDFQDAAGESLFKPAFTVGQQQTPIAVCDAYQVVVTNVSGGNARFRLPFQLSN